MVVLTQKDQRLLDSDSSDITSNLLISASSDAPPPAYEDLVSNHDVTPLSTLTHGEEKRRSTGSLTATSDREGDGTGRRASTSNISQSQSKRSIGINKTWFSWFSEKDTRKEVKQTIQSLIKDVTKDPRSPTAACVLQSCLEACQSKGLSFQTIISEKFMEGHCPIYWAIAKRTPKTPNGPDSQEAEPPVEDDDSSKSVELLDILLSMPLNPTTRLEAYSACLLTSDNTLFQRLRNTPDEQTIPNVGANTSISADELLLGEEPGDEIQVFDGDADYGEFRILWDIAHFQRRMRAIGRVSIQVVARGHIWCLSFIILQKDHFSNGSTLKAGTWIVCVSLVEPSPASRLYAQIRIPEPEPLESARKLPKRSASALSDETSGSTSTKSSSPISKIGRKGLWPNVSKPSNTGANGGSSPAGSKPPIILSLKTDSNVTDDPLEPISLSASQDLSNYPPSTRRKYLVAPLDKHQNGYSLQFDGTSYLNSKGTLRVIFEAGLSKRSSGSDCIIC